MEKTLEKGTDKIQKICDALRKETLIPAQEEAVKLIQEAKSRAEHIIREAHEQANKHIEDAKSRIEQERNVFHSSIQQAGKQAVEKLRQTIEEDLFNDELQKLVETNTANPQIIAKLVECLIKAIEKEGTSSELSALIPTSISSKDVNTLLGESILKKLKENGVILGQFGGGVQIKLLDKKMTLDITDKTLTELLSQYVRKDFRKLLFNV